MSNLGYSYRVESYVLSYNAMVKTDEETLYGTSMWAPAGTVLWRAVEVEKLSLRQRFNRELPEQRTMQFAKEHMAAEQVAAWVAERAENLLRQQRAQSHVSKGWQAEFDSSDLLRLARRALAGSAKNAA